MLLASAGSCLAWLLACAGFCLGMARFSLCRLILGIAGSRLCRLNLGLTTSQPLQAHVWHCMLPSLESFSGSLQSLRAHVCQGMFFFGCEFVGSRTQQVHLTSRWKATSTWQLESSMCTRMTTARSGSLSPLIPEQENLLTSLCLDLLKKQL